MTRDRTFGPSYVEGLDRDRLTGQLKTIRDYMLDGVWRSLPEIAEATGFPEASISADLRHLRKLRFGAYQVEKRRRTVGTWEYSVKQPRPIRDGEQLSMLVAVQ